MKRILAPLTVCFLAIFLVHCENEKESDLFRAQQCINTATAATVNDCLNFLNCQFKNYCGVFIADARSASDLVVVQYKKIHTNGLGREYESAFIRSIVSHGR